MDFNFLPYYRQKLPIMFDKEEIDSTLLQYLLNELNEEDRKATEAWIHCQPAHQEYLKKFLESHIQFKAAIQINHIHTEYPGLVRKLHRHRSILLFTRIAAIIVLLIGVSLSAYFIRQSQQINEQITAESTIHPGSSKAILHLSTGTSIDINTESQNMQEQDGTNIQISSNGSLQYSQSVHPSKVTEFLNRLEIPRGGEFSITLSDGTQVWLNAETELEYPTTFSGKTRTVSLKGEAYFKVAHGPQSPFIVRVGEIDVKVYGTEFNINTQKKDKIETVLVNGSVNILYQGKETPLQPSQMASFIPSLGEIKVSEVNILPYVAWKEGNFMFHNETLENIMEKLSRWYDLNVFYVNENVKQIRLSGMMEKYKDVNELFHYFEKISAARFTTNGKTVTINVR